MTLFKTRIIRRGFLNGEWQPIAVAWPAYARPSARKRMLPMVTFRILEN
jgi:hypothetical protein